MLLSVFVSDILPIFLVAGVGFLLSRFLAIDVQMLARVVFNALAPCLILDLLLASPLTGPDFGRMALFCVVVTAAIGLIARIVAIPLALDRPTLAGFLLVVMFSNGGNYGLPATLFAFGREALAHATVYFVTSAMLTYTVGVLLAKSGRRTLWQAIAGIVTVPAVYGLASAGVLLALDITPPEPLMRPVRLLSDAALPMMMLVLGMQLERSQSFEHPRAIMAASLLSLLVAPILAFVAVDLIDLTGPARQAAILEASMPAAVVTTILALEFDAAPSFVTNVVFTSTLLSPITVTLLIAYLR
jgi:predicted permease